MSKSCSIEGCVTKHYSRGWCKVHYQRWRKHGDPLVVKPGNKGSRPIPEGSAEGPTKICTKCNISKPISGFGPNRRAVDGLNWWCRGCWRDYARSYRATRRDTYKAYARKHYAQQLAKLQVAKVCEECGGEFTTARLDQRFCQDSCSRKFHKRKAPPEPWNARRRANYQKRRALKKGATTGDPVLLAEIRERDGNRCGICGKNVGSKPYPHPLSPSLDHVVPLSVGGAHDPANVQLAHLRCNISKGNRGGGEQLRMA